MITKCVQIPAYIINFLFGCIGCLLSVWGLGIIIFVIITDFITIFFTGISSIGCTVLMKKQGALSNKLTLLCGIGSFTYCFDVIISIIYYKIAKKHTFIEVTK